MRTERCQSQIHGSKGSFALVQSALSEYKFSPLGPPKASIMWRSPFPLIVITFVLHPHLCAQDQPPEPLPAIAVQAPSEPPPEEYVYWANHVMGVELNVFRLRLVPSNHQAASTTDFGWNGGLGLVLGAVKREGWSPFFRFSAFHGESTDNFVQPGFGDVAGLQRDVDFEFYELGILTPGFGSDGMRLYGDLSIGIPALHLDRMQAHDDFLRRSLLTNDRQSFVGAGPHVGLNGEIPILDRWFIDGRVDTGVYWGGFRTHEDESLPSMNFTMDTFRQNKGGVLGQLGGELGLTYLYQGETYRLYFSAGYRYSTWFSNDLWTLEDITTHRSRIEQAGPYFRFVFQY
jgi:hypothetical protein